MEFLACAVLLVMASSWRRFARRGLLDCAVLLGPASAWWHLVQLGLIDCTVFLGTAFSWWRLVPRGLLVVAARFGQSSRGITRPRRVYFVCYTVYKCPLYSTQCTSVRCTVYMCTLYSAQCILYSAQCRNTRVQTVWAICNHFV